MRAAALGVTNRVDTGITRAARRTPTAASGGEYGAHWWLDRGGPGPFSAVGFEGQYLHLDPVRDVIVARMGVSTPEQRRCVEDELIRLIASAPEVT